MPVRMRGHRLILEDAPSGDILKSIKLRIDIEPGSGGVLVYGSPDYVKPMRAHGPRAVLELATKKPVIFVQLIGGAETATVGVLSFTDSGTGRTSEPVGAPLTLHNVAGRGQDAEFPTASLAASFGHVELDLEGE
jgi:hypothetical protein